MNVVPAQDSWHVSFLLTEVGLRITARIASACTVVHVVILLHTEKRSTTKFNECCDAMLWMTVLMKRWANTVVTALDSARKMLVESQADTFAHTPWKRLYAPMRSQSSAQDPVRSGDLLNAWRRYNRLWLLAGMRRWMRRYTLTRSGFFVSSRATSLFSWWWWRIRSCKASPHTSSGSGATTSWICGTCGTCARNLDWSCCLTSCGGWSSSPWLIGIGISWGSGDDGRIGNRSRDVFPVPTLSLYHQQVEELEAILMEVEADLAVQARRCRRSTRSKRNIRIVKKGKVWRRWIVSLISSFILRCNQLGLTCRRQPLSTHVDQMRCRKNELGYRTNPHANWSWTGFPEEYPSNRFTAGRKESKFPPKVPWSNIQNQKCMFGKTWRRQTDHLREKSYAIADGFPWRIKCVHEPKDSHLLMAYWTSAVKIFCKLLNTWWPMQCSEDSTLKVGPWSNSWQMLLPLVCSNW